MNFKIVSPSDFYDIILSPGHGGSDPGASGNGLVEKELTLLVSRYMYRRFVEHGVKVAMVRNDDTTVSYQPRSAMVKNNALYCIDNHFNAGGGDGAEVIKSIYDNTSLGDDIGSAITNSGQNVRRVFTRSLASNPKQDHYYMHRLTGSVNTQIIEWYFIDNELDILDTKTLFTCVEAVIRVYVELLGKDYQHKDLLDEIPVWGHDGWIWGYSFGLNDGLVQNSYEIQHMTIAKRMYDQFIK